MLRRDLAAGSRAAEPRWVPRPALRGRARRFVAAPDLAEVLDVDDAQRARLQAQFGTLQRQRRTADLALQGLRLAGRQRLDAQLQARAAVVEAALVERVALVDERLVDLDAGAALAVGIAQQHLAGEQLRHAGVVVLDDEALEFQLEGQALPDAAAGQVDARDLALAALGHEEVGAEGRRARLQHMARLDRTAALVELLALQAHGGLHEQVAVQQAAQADQHDGAMRGQVAELVHLALARRQQRALGSRVDARLPAGGLQALQRQRRGGGGVHLQLGLGVVGVGTQRLRADRQLGVAPVARDLGRLAGDAQAGAEDQEGQDQQEPGRAVDRVQIQRAEQLGPEGAELVDVIGQRFTLAHHGADDGGDADDAQQRDGKAHRGQQVLELAQGGSHGGRLFRMQAGRRRRGVGREAFELRACCAASTKRAHSGMKKAGAGTGFSGRSTRLSAARRCSR
jgi:hypothetical protein